MTRRMIDCNAVAGVVGNLSWSLSQTAQVLILCSVRLKDDSDERGSSRGGIDP